MHDIRAAESGWEVLDMKDQDGVLRVRLYRRIPVLIKVSAAGRAQTLSMDTVRVRSELVQAAEGLLPRSVGHPAPDGQLTVSLPRLPGLRLLAEADGWYPDSALVPMSSATEHAIVNLVLRSSMRLSGTLRNEDGSPIAGARVLAYVTVEGTPTTFTREDAAKLAKRGGYSYVIDESANLSYAVFVYYAETGGDGDFAIDARVEGHALLVSHVERHAPARTGLGIIRTHRSDINLVGRRSVAGDPVAVFIDGVPASGATIALTDLSAGRAQPAVMLRADHKGHVAPDWLEIGRRYWLRAGLAIAEFEWRSQPRIDAVTVNR